MKSKKSSEVIIKIFKSNGFVLSEPDVLLDSEYIIERSGEKFRTSMLTFEREDGKIMCLRPDLTVASCISFLQKKSSSKIYYSGQAYRRSHNKGSDLFYKIGNSLFSVPQMHKNNKYTKIYQKELYKGYANKNFIPYYPHRIWPYWVYKQIGINSNSYNSQGLNPILTNTTSRNWTPLSFPGCNETPIVDPKGLITPMQDGWSLDFWVANSEKVLSPSQINKIHQSFNPQSGTITTHYETEHLKVSSETF